MFLNKIILIKNFQHERNGTSTSILKGQIEMINLHLLSQVFQLNLNTQNGTDSIDLVKKQRG